MGESIRPATDSGEKFASSNEITDDVLDRWIANGDNPVLCTALLRRMQADLNAALGDRVDKIHMPPALLDLYEISTGRFEDPVVQFQAFCAKYLIDATGYIEFNKKLAKGKPIEFNRMRTFAHMALLILCDKLGVDKTIFQADQGAGLFVVGGARYAQAEKLALELHKKIGY